jgi:hypothetical protein
VIASGVAEIKDLFDACGRDSGGLVVSVPFSVDADPEIAAMADHVTAVGRRCGNGAPYERRSLSASECIARIDALRAAGVNNLTLEFAWSDPAELREKLGRFSSEVMPAFSS